MRRRLDIIGFHALNADEHLLRVTNRQFRELIETRFADLLPTEHLDLYAKLLASDRSRYIAAVAIDEALLDDHQRRYERYSVASSKLGLACVAALLRKSPVSPQEIRAVVTNHTVGGMIPNLSSIVCNHLGLASETKVIDLGYMGCAAALLALELVGQQLGPGEVGLVLSVELTSAMMNLSATTEASLIANTVFGDGVGAFLVARQPHRHKPVFRVLDHSGSLLASDQALSAITYRPNPVYHEIRLAETIPEVAKEGIRSALEPLVRRNLVTLGDKAAYLMLSRQPRWQKRLSHVVFHTAGSKILRSLQESMELTDGQVGHNYQAFERHGNTSSASIYYALDTLMGSAKPRSNDRILLLGYGSGFFTRACLLQAS